MSEIFRWKIFTLETFVIRIVELLLHSIRNDRGNCDFVNFKRKHWKHRQVRGEIETAAIARRKHNNVQKWKRIAGAGMHD